MMMLTMTLTMVMITMVTMMRRDYGNRPGPAFAQFPPSIARLRPEPAQLHLSYRINHFSHCNSKSTHEVKYLQYELRKVSAIEKHHSGLSIWALFVIWRQMD